MSSSRLAAIRIIAIRRPFALFDPQPWRPSLNIYETEQAIHLIAELAGVAPDELQVHVHPVHVVIRGTRQVPTPAGLRRIHRLEIVAGPFQVEVPLPTPVDPERAQARYGAGLLDVWLPFASQTNQRVVVIRPGVGGAP